MTVPSEFEIEPRVAVDIDPERMRLAPLASVIEPRLVQALVVSMVTDEFASMVMTLDAVVVKVVGRWSPSCRWRRRSCRCW